MARSTAEAAPAPPPPGSAPAPIEGAQTAESETQTVFTLPYKVSVAAGQSLVLPILDRELPAQRVDLYQSSADQRHPLAANRASCSRYHAAARERGPPFCPPRRLIPPGAPSPRPRFQSQPFHWRYLRWYSRDVCRSRETQSPKQITGLRRSAGRQIAPERLGRHDPKHRADT
jgi:hypothetical protein